MNDDSPYPPAAGGVSQVNGFTVTVRDSLAGAKFAYRYGQTLFVSPAMWELLRGAEGPEELTFVLNHIPVAVVPYTPPGYVRPVYCPAFAPPQLGAPQ
jgi:hypothetical protein